MGGISLFLRLPVVGMGAVLAGIMLVQAGNCGTRQSARVSYGAW